VFAKLEGHELSAGTVTIPNVNLYDQLLGREAHSHD